jgi:hypothetical protein
MQAADGKNGVDVPKGLSVPHDTRQAENAARIVKLMEEQGLADPYIRLTEKPEKVSRWCSRHWLKAGERKSGGRRRKGA